MMYSSFAIYIIIIIIIIIEAVKLSLCLNTTHRRGTGGWEMSGQLQDQSTFDRRPGDLRDNLDVIV